MSDVPLGDGAVTNELPGQGLWSPREDGQDDDFERAVVDLRVADMFNEPADPDPQLIAEFQARQGRPSIPTTSRQVVPQEYVSAPVVSTELVMTATVEALEEFSDKFASVQEYLYACRVITANIIEGVTA